MTADFTALSVCAAGETALRAAELLCDAVELRSGVRPPVVSAMTDVCVCLRVTAELPDKDSFILRQHARQIEIEAAGIRALIYGYSYFLRKCTFFDGRITLVRRIDGTYTPDQPIRGHQMGFRAISNTYDAWTPERYRQYYLDCMAFGCNTVEHIPALFPSDRNALMPLAPDELLAEASRLADTLDLDVSLWMPNDTLPLEESVRLREALFRRCPRLDVVFPPGGDPGEYAADAFMDRVCAIADALHRVHPHAAVWPSAQAPHGMPDWGEELLRRLETLPAQVDGIITGPNRAFPLDELRRRLPAQYPIRLYPDITHNVRCEYPVHALRDDWHYAFAAALSRECINPRPREFRTIHRLTRPYVCGSVTYSEGVNDDVNKMVWADMEYDPNRPLRETLLDYARFFLWQAPADALADLILALESNWIGDPAENPQIDDTLRNARRLESQYPALRENWRFCQLLFRACCDALVRQRRLFESELLERARAALRAYDAEAAEAILMSPFPDGYTVLRREIDDLAQTLFTQIGMQLDVKRFGASHWERGATLETIDLPVTDRRFYQNRLAFARTLPPQERNAFFDALLCRNRVRADEVYFSFAEHGLDAAGEAQTPDFYMDFQGDRPDVNDGSMPMCQTKLYDHFSFRCRLAGLTGGDYRLRVSYSARKDPAVTQHRVTVNGRVIYCGAQYGGEKDPQFDRRLLAPGTETAAYRLPADCFVNGCAELVIEEPTQGVRLSEFWVLRDA